MWRRRWTTAAFTKKRIAPVIHKLLTSAVDNAKYVAGEQGIDLDVDNLYVKQALANDGPRMKRIRPAPMGRAFRYQRRLTHIILSVAEREAKARPGDQGGRAGVAQSGKTPKAESRARQEGSEEDRRQAKATAEGRGTEEEGQQRRPRKCLRGNSMGQKVHPYGFRLGVNKPWRSRWFSERDYEKLLVEDVKLKAELREKLKAAGVSSVEIERPGNKLRFLIRTARPGIVIGRKGAEIEKLKTELGKRTNRDVFIDIIEVNKPELDAQLVSENIALQLEKRVSFRRAMRKSVDSALRFGCKGIKVRVSGRLNGNEIARSEWYLQGRLPLHTLRADIDYGFTEANTTYGVIGVKTWIYRGDIYEQKRRQAPAVGTSVF